jgi:hypothetical protein
MIGAPMDLYSIARALGGEICGGQVLAPGPGHSAKDLSLSVKPSPDAPGGFTCFSHAGDNWQTCRDYVRAKLNLPVYNERKNGRRKPSHNAYQARNDSPITRTQLPLKIWAESVDPRGTDGEVYLRSDRAIYVDDNLSQSLRWHEKSRALIALFRDIETDKPRAISRIFLDAEGHKIERKFLGPVRGCAVKIDDDSDVTIGLIVGEGVETCLAAKQLGFSPVWALGSVGAIETFPVLGGIECLTILAEAGEPSRKAVQKCFERWRAAGREILIRKSIIGSDFNDAIRGAI